MENEKVEPSKSISSGEARSVHQDTHGGAAINIGLGEYMKDRTPIIALIALVIAVCAFLLSWYGEREGRLAQYSLAGVDATQAATDAQVKELRYELDLEGKLASLQADVDRLSQLTKEQRK